MGKEIAILKSGISYVLEDEFFVYRFEVGGSFVLGSLILWKDDLGAQDLSQKTEIRKESRF
ncbi:hypothetical protein [Leptospira stimsonii]|uniref:Uncharacterized protein n=1 Tax=Leptospira stimsonii TaxID=2202203 RepID=A0A396Z165_9LEPT|nr:hypothetical protein [Leptospira stimsonii]RHX87394.1 hypothetical protein DLM75_18060 [Leptospira stimsonii]